MRIDRLCSLTADNEGQRKRCDVLRGELAGLPAQARDSSGSRAITTTLRAMAVDERELMVVRQDAQDRAARHAAIVSAASLAACVSLALAAHLALSRSAKALARAKAALRHNQELYHALADNLPKMSTAIFDANLRYQLVDGAKLLASIGRTCDEFRGHTVEECVPVEHRDWVAELYRGALAGVEGTIDLVFEGRDFSLAAVPIHDAKRAIIGGLSVMTDITEGKVAQQKLTDLADQLRSLSLRDELTGLFNRRGFHARATEHAVVAQSTGRAFGVIFADLNGLKAINDCFGHDEGDAAIREMGAILEATFRVSDVVARLGGDEFVVLVRDADASALGALVERLRAAVEVSNVRVDRTVDRLYVLSASLGTAVWTAGNELSIDALLEQADHAMYVEKHRRGALCLLPSGNDAPTSAAARRRRASLTSPPGRLLER